MTFPRMMKYLDALCGRPVVTVLARFFPVLPQKDDINFPRSFLLIRPGGIGDAVLLAPTVQALMAHFPGVSIDFLVEKRNRSVIAMYGSVGKIYYYDRPLDLFAVMSCRYDAVIDTEQWYRLSSIVARLIRAEMRIGFATNVRSKMFSHPVAYSLEEYEGASFLRLLEPFGIFATLSTEALPLLVIPREAEIRAASLCVGLNQESTVVLFPGASIPEKRWGADRFRQVGKVLAEKGLTLLVVGGREEAAEGMRIVAGGRGVNLAGKTSLVETAAIVARAAVVVSGDSGVLHLAYALGRPTVSLFGPSSVAKWAAQGASHVVVHGKPSCSPCSRFGQTPKCPHNVECMQSITVEEVTNAVCELLQMPKEGNTN